MADSVADMSSSHKDDHKHHQKDHHKDHTYHEKDHKKRITTLALARMKAAQ